MTKRDGAADVPSSQPLHLRGHERDATKTLHLLLLGDCMIGRLVNEVLESQPPEYPWGDTLPLLHAADWRMCNLECVISDRGTPWSVYEKAFHFRSAAKNIAVLEKAQINAVTLANNHVLDYDYDALFETLGILDRAGIAHAGAGANLEAASRPATAVVHGTKLGLLAFSDNEPDWEATAEHAGMFYVPVDLNDPRAQHLLEIVHSVAKQVDLLIVSAHWGSNWGYAPPEEHVEFAHALVDAGAGLIFGHSSHVFRAIESYQERPIVYGAGNFVDDYAVDKIERNDQAFIYTAEVEDGVPRHLDLYPTMIRSCQARRATGLQERSIIEKMQELCSAFGTGAIWNQARRVVEIRGAAARNVKSALSAP